MTTHVQPSPRPTPSIERGPQRVGAAIAVALHVIAVAGLLSYEPARSALLAAAPIMVDWIAPPRAEPPPPEPPKPKPVVRPQVVKPVEPPPVMVAAEHAPSPILAPAPPPEPPAPPEPAPAVVVVAPPETPPIFNADYLDNPAPAYPLAARRAGEQGRVLLRVLVNTGGTADEVEVRTSSGHARLDDAARETVRLWRFVPAKRGPVSVPAWVLIPISFRLEG